MTGRVRFVRLLGTVLVVPLTAGSLAGSAAAADPRSPERCAGPASTEPVEDAVVLAAPRRDVVVFARHGQPDGTVRVSPTWVEVPGQGTWTVDAGNGDVVHTPGARDAQSDGDEAVVFTPEEGYDEDPATDADTDTDTTTAADTAPPPVLAATCRALALRDGGATEQGVGLTLRPLANDRAGARADGGRATLADAVLTLDAGPDGAGAGVDTLAVPGEGTWRVGQAGRTVVFVPAPAFTGRTSAVRYRTEDSAGHPVSSTLRVDVSIVAPRAEPDTARTGHATAVTLDVLANDDSGAESAPLLPETLRLVSEEGDGVDDLDVAGQGAWAVTDGELVLEPADRFSGTTAPVRYTVADENGTRASATAQVAVAPRAAPRRPDAVDDRARTAYQTPVGIDVLDNDLGALVATTLSLVDGSGDADVLRQRLEVDGEGVWRVVDGRLRFVPDEEFSGAVTPVVYRVENGNAVPVRGKVRLTVEEPGEALPTEVTTTSGTPVTAVVLDNVTAAGTEELRPGTVCVRPARVRVDGRRLGSDGDASRCTDDARRPDVGRWEVDDDGAVRFTPRADFTGRTAIGFRVSATGGTVYSSVLAVEVSAPPAPAATPTRPPTSTTPAPVVSPTPTGGGILPDTGGPTALALLAGLALLAAGALVVRRTRRRV